MLSPIPEETQHRIDTLLDKMSIEEKIGQTLCPVAWDFHEEASDDLIERTRKRIEEYHIGCMFIANGSEENTRKLKKMLKGMPGVPVIECADMENGAGARVPGKLEFPSAMATGAANDEDLLEQVAEITALQGRALGTHWTLAPVTDMCRNIDNPMTFERTYGSSPEHVSRMTRAFIHGIQKDGLMAATAKHFPGDSCEQREPHICAPVNLQTKEEWMDTYGKVWKEVIECGVMSIMIGHIALPCIDSTRDYRGCVPATLSKKIQIDFLRHELGFKGVTISDASSMLGFSAYASVRDRCWQNIATGCDVHLFSYPEIDFPGMLKAVERGELTEQRCTEAARRVLELKARVGLFDDLDIEDPPAEVVNRYTELGDAIAEKSICMVRNEGEILPLELEEKDKVLTISLAHTEGLRHGQAPEVPCVDEELENRGFNVDHFVNPGCFKVKELIENNEYKVIFINLVVPPRYGTTKMYGDMVQTLWNGFWSLHPRVVFSSFGDPFKLYEIPYAPNWLMAFSHSEFSQRAMVKVWLGEIKAQGQCPVTLPGFFAAEV